MNTFSTELTHNKMAKLTPDFPKIFCALYCYYTYTQKVKNEMKVYLSWSGEIDGEAHNTAVTAASYDIYQLQR